MFNEPVLFLPGTLCDERVWLPVWKQLSLAQRRYVPLQWATSLDDMLALTADRVLSDEKVHLVGYSMGGYIASKWALQNPSSVASLTLIGYNPQGLGVEELKRRKQLLTFLKNGPFTPRSAKYLQKFVHPDALSRDDVAGVVADMGEDLGKGTLLAHTHATTPREDLVADLRNAPFRTHMLAAKQDMIAPFEVVSAVAAQLNDCTLYPIEDAGHMMLLEKPEDTASALQHILHKSV